MAADGNRRGLLMSRWRSPEIFRWPLVAGPLKKRGILYIVANRSGKVQLRCRSDLT